MTGFQRWKHWCPHGCGKKVEYNTKTKHYECEKCRFRFKKRDVKKQGD